MPDHDGNLELSPAARFMLNSLTTEVKELRSEFQQLGKELRVVTEAIIAMRTENVAARLSKLQDEDLRVINRRLDEVERFQVRTMTAVTAIGTILMLLNGAVGIYAILKK